MNASRDGRCVRSCLRPRQQAQLFRRAAGHRGNHGRIIVWLGRVLRLGDRVTAAMPRDIFRRAHRVSVNLEHAAGRLIG